jgi:hypothetical protein
MKIGKLERAWGAEALRPVVGWKVWRVDVTDDVRLRSVLYGDLWPTADPLRADCRRMLHQAHEAPCAGCECGVHAGRELAAWEHYLAIDAETRVFGRVLLWGSTIEGSAGWRAEQARPVEIFVPAAVENAPRVAEGLSTYGVAVHVLEAAPAEELLAR